MATQFGILGELIVVRDGESCSLGSLRQRGLLARLVIRAGQPLSADRLIDELWPAEVPDTARHTLHVYISRLRAALGEDRARLKSDPSGYRLCLDADELDASRFERLATQGRTALGRGDAEAAATRLRQALGLWRGPALVEFADEAFAGTEATRLEQLRLTAREDRIWADLALGRHLDLTEELHELTLEQPFREVPWEQYMVALYRSGRQADAIHAFAQARMYLADELGIEPGPALRRMEQRVLAQDPTLAQDALAPPGGRRHALADVPPQRTAFVGRERDLAIAAELLRASRLLTLTGAPGSGKTRMALRLATDHHDRYADGVCFVPLASHSDARAAGTAIAAALDLPQASDDEPWDRLSDLLKGQELLLVLDNLEQLRAAGPRLSHLLDEAPRLRLLVTSREPLGLTGEQEFPVLPLAVPPNERWDDPIAVAAYDAVCLLVARARAADPDFAVTRDNCRAVAEITARLDGLPLALELGAGRLRVLTPQGLLDRLERRLPLLSTGSTDAIDRHQTLRGAISWSYELLPPDERPFFRSLSAFAGGFSADAAGSVAGIAVDEAWAGIESLLSRSLLQRTVEVGEARFAMLQTIREFAAEQLAASGEAEAVAGRHARYYLELAKEDETEPTEAAHDAADTGLAREIENVRVALGHCLHDGDLEIGLRLAGLTWRTWQALGQITEGREWLRRMLAVGAGSPSARADALVALAGLAYWQADYAAALDAYEEALELYRAIDAPAEEAEVLYGLSMNSTWHGDPGAGRRLAAEARALFEAQGIRAKVGETSMAEGFALWQDHDYVAARPLWEEALAISREVGADTLAVTQLAGLAGIEYHTGARADATRIALDALAQACDLKNVALCIWLLDFIAAFAVADDATAAVRVAGAADALRQASGGGMRVEDLHIEPARSAAAASLGHRELEQAWSRGRSLTLEEAIDEARALRPVSIA